MTDKLVFINEEMDALRESNLLINIRTMESAADGWMVVDGRGRKLRVRGNADARSTEHTYCSPDVDV